MSVKDNVHVLLSLFYLVDLLVYCQTNVCPGDQQGDTACTCFEGSETDTSGSAFDDSVLELGNVTIMCDGSIHGLIIAERFGDKSYLTLKHLYNEEYYSIIKCQNVSRIPTQSSCCSTNFPDGTVLNCNFNRSIPITKGDTIQILLQNDTTLPAVCFSSVDGLIHFQHVSLGLGVNPDRNCDQLQPLVMINLEINPTTVTISDMGPDHEDEHEILIGAAMIAVVVLFLFVIAVVLIVWLVLWSRKKSRSYVVNKSESNGTHLANLIYGHRELESSGTSSRIEGGPIPQNTTAATVTVNTAANDYSEIEDSHIQRATVNTGVYHSLDEATEGTPSKTAPDQTGVGTSPYEIPRSAQQEGTRVYNDYEWDLVVPSQEQRTRAFSFRLEKSFSESNKPDQQHFYHLLEPTESARGGPPSKFFEECDSYWAPSSNASELYEQLSRKKYREIPRHHIQSFEVLGSGAFGTVNKGLWQSPGGAMEVAVKTIQSDSEEEKVKFLQEAAIMGQFRHPSVVKLMGVVTVEEPLMIVLELLSNGDLSNFLIKMKPEPGEMVPSGTPALLLKFCQQISCGMEYLARKAFVHRDLAARNILVSGDKNCKISDFGMSRNLIDENYYVARGGKIPVKWTAPEAINYKKYSTASDVWSFGCVMYEIWSLGHKPFEAYDNAETIKMVDRGMCLPPPPGCPRELYRLMVECWHPESSRRPSFAQLVEMLSQADFELLLWREEDTQIGPQVSVVGAPLEASKDLYSDLQQVYLFCKP